MSMCALTVYFDFHLSVPPSTALCHQTKVQYWLVGVRADPGTSLVQHHCSLPT